jgi:hypothetical protein
VEQIFEFKIGNIAFTFFGRGENGEMLILPIVMKARHTEPFWMDVLLRCALFAILSV